MKLGVDYYPDHWPKERWAIDARMMRESGLDIVRVAEFAWALMEPEESEYDWTWLDQAIETLSAEGLQVVLGTPTATPPAWLVRTYPEILPVDNQGRVREFGSRRHYCVNSPIYREHSHRIVKAMAKRYGRHPAVLGWQIDNEFGCHDTARCYCPECAKQFRNWLKRKYGTIDILNRAWGAVFWSQRYSNWEEINLPILTVTEPNPSHVLDYYRFASDSNRDYQQIQVDIIRQDSPGKLITTNFMGNFPDLDYYDMAEPLDFCCWDSYPTGYAETADLYDSISIRPSLAFDAGDPYITGFCHDLTRGFKQAPFWVMEQQAGHINWAKTNPIVREGSVRLWTWHALASGADAVVYFRWRACLYAQEQYHSGLLHHDSTPDVGLRDVNAMLTERSLMAKIASEPIQPQAAILHSYQDLWSIKLQPHQSEFGYHKHLFVYYQAFQRLGIPVDIISPQADLEQYKLLVVPSMILGDERVADRLEKFVEKGGILLLGVRCGFKTVTNLVVNQPLPGVFSEIAGMRVTDWGTLPHGIGFNIQSTEVELPGKTQLWIESLSPDSAKCLAKYSEGPYTGKAALTMNSRGKGNTLYLGIYPSVEQAQAVLRFAAQHAGLKPLCDGDLPVGVVAARRGNYVILLNFCDTIQQISVLGENYSVSARDIKVIAL